MKIRVLFFDLDDTLIPSEAIYKTGLKAAWSELRQTHPMSWPRFQRLYQQARGGVKARLGRVPAARSRMLYFKQLAESVMGRSSPRLATALMRAYDTCWKAIDPIPAQTIARALSKTYRLGIVTNQVASFQLSKMNRIDPTGQWFKHVITSEEVGCEKPDRRFFAYACRVAHCKPSEAVVIGNSLEDDVRGAVKAGLGAIYVKRGPRAKSLPGRTLQIGSLQELDAALETLSLL